MSNTESASYTGSRKGVKKVSVPAIGKRSVLGPDRRAVLIRLTNMVDAAGTTTYKYYAGGQLWTEDGPWADDTVTNYYNTARMRIGKGSVLDNGIWTPSTDNSGVHQLQLA